MSLFFQLFDTGIPWQLFILTFLVAISASAWLYHKSRKQILLPWIMAVLFLMLYTAILRRTSQPEYSIHLMPFWSIQAIQEGYIETLYEKIYNVIFFVPYGCLLGLKGSNSSSSSKGSKGMKGAVLIGFLTSVGIELLQLITRTGTCETDDVICNTLGCGIGAVMGALTMTGLRSMTMTITMTLGLEENEDKKGLK